MNRTRHLATAVLVSAALVASACGSDDGSADTTATEPTSSATTPTSERVADTAVPADTDPPADTAPQLDVDADGVLEVPGEYETIQLAVDTAQSGDLVLIAPGVYNEAVNVVNDGVTIRGLDRNEVILDGEFELDNGIRVLGADGVAVENLTARNYASNGFFWTGVDGYRGSYLTATRNGDYGVYAYDSVNGLFEHSYASGSPDAGFYIGQCFECNAVLDDVVSEYNGLGYSGTNAGGNLLIVNSRFNNNRVGINTNSATYELCYPQRNATIIGNLVYSNNQADTPAIDDAVLAMNNGILVEGGIGNVIERNRVFDHAKTGIGLVPYPESLLGDPSDAEPGEDTWDLPCSEARELPLADPETIEPFFWYPKNNRVVGNVVEGNGDADLAIAVLGADLQIVDPNTLGNCFAGNTFETSAPTDVELILPCDAAGNGGDWLLGDLGIASWIADQQTAPPSVDYDVAPTPDPPLLDGMADPDSSPARPATDMSPVIDTASITVPDRPAG